MADDDVVAIATGLIAHDAHLAGESGTNGIADVDLNVKAFVLATPAGSKVTGDDAAWRRHAKVA